MATKSILGGMMQLAAARLSAGDPVMTYITIEDQRKAEAIDAKRKADAQAAKRNRKPGALKRSKRRR